MYEFRPVPKPNFKRVKPKGTQKRNAIDDDQYQKAIEEHGSYCHVCGKAAIEMHHVKFRSQGGRGVWRNLMPLCEKHHRMAHTEKGVRQMLEKYLKEKYGPYYYMDRYDLYDLGVINSTSQNEFEQFMEKCGESM